MSVFPLSLRLCTSVIPVRSSFGLIIYSSCPAASFPASLKSSSNLVVLLSINDVEYCLLVLTDSFGLWSLFHFFHIVQNVSLFLSFFSLKPYTTPYAVLAKLWLRSEMREATEFAFPVDFRFFIKSI